VTISKQGTPTPEISPERTPPMSRLHLALAAIGGAIYLAVSYAASSSTHPPLFAVLVVLAPLVIGTLAACWHTRLRYVAIILCLLGLILITLRADWLTRYAASFFFLQHIGAMGSLGIFFGGTLGSKEDALCSRIARFAIPTPLDAQYINYTWKVTLTWTIYFALFAIISVGLFFFAPLTTWSIFATFVTPASVFILFACEFLVRGYALPGRPSFTIAQTIDSYRKYTRQQRYAK